MTKETSKKQVNLRPYSIFSVRKLKPKMTILFVFLHAHIFLCFGISEQAKTAYAYFYNYHHFHMTEWFALFSSYKYQLLPCSIDTIII